jgi:hypothetical protein
MVFSAVALGAAAMLIWRKSAEGSSPSILAMRDLASLLK